MRVLIMGGTTFVSKQSAIHFINKGDEVTIVTRGKKKVDYEGIFEHISLDRHEESELKQLKDKEFDVVIDVSAYTEDDVKSLVENINLENLKRYIFVSSGAVYNPRLDKAMNENDQRGHNEEFGTYGYNKFLAEEYLFSLYKNKDFPMVIVRPTYLYGEDNIIYRESYFFQMLENNREIPVPNSNSKTQFIYIKDLMRIFDDLIKNDSVCGEAFNVTNPTILTFKEMVEEIANAINIQPKITSVDYEVKFVERDFFPYKDVTYILSTDKLKKFGIYVPDTSFKDGIEKTYKWYKESGVEINDEKMNKQEEVILFSKNKEELTKSL